MKHHRDLSWRGRGRGRGRWLRSEERYYERVRRDLQRAVGWGSGATIAAEASLLLATAALADQLRAHFYPPPSPVRLYVSSAERRKAWATITECAEPAR